MSAPPMPVDPVKAIHAPRVLQPVAFGDTQVWVSGITPGAQVTVSSDGQVIGQTNAAESIVRVPIVPVPSAVTASSSLCTLTKSGVRVDPIIPPGADGTFASAGEEYRSYGMWNAPVTADGDAFAMKIEGELYYPGDEGGKLDPNVRNLPLVIIAHGFWTPGVESYKGYDYLAKHLARWGMIVFSINMAR